MPIYDKITVPWNIEGQKFTLLVELLLEIFLSETPLLIFYYEIVNNNAKIFF